MPTLSHSYNQSVSAIRRRRDPCHCSRTRFRGQITAVPIQRARGEHFPASRLKTNLRLRKEYDHEPEQPTPHHATNAADGLRARTSVRRHGMHRRRMDRRCVGPGRVVTGGPHTKQAFSFLDDRKGGSPLSAAGATVFRFGIS